MVAWTPQVIDRLHHPNAKNGAEIATNICASCHGENGVSPNPQFPHMAGQSAFAIYKQLHDFKNGARVNELMASIVQDLDDEQMADVAAHFSALTKGALDPRTISSGDPDVVRLVEYGVSARAIPGCASCHGAHAGGPIETPTLAGQRQEYLLAQLTAFANGDRTTISTTVCVGLRRSCARMRSKNSLNITPLSACSDRKITLQRFQRRLMARRRSSRSLGAIA